MAIDRTAKAVFDKAMFLMDAQSESSGATLTGDTKEYQVRTIGILNNLLDVVYPASSTFTIWEKGARPALDDIESLDDVLDLDARILRDVLPNGLAAKLLSEENPTLSNYFQQCFEEGLAMAATQVPAQFEDIDGAVGGMYGGVEHGQFGRWM